ncbi:hypothetical protein [Halorubrum sp. HHNYT27]|uniref:hypothetical protein n=1 Tax=Halorubrum sp. HHNYT27 TaxID=3402275 RepID=UPI003EC12552
MSDGPVTTMGAGGAGGTAAESSNGLATDVDVSNIESPLSVWLANSRWSRRDLELLTDLIGAIGTLGFLYLALNGVGA